MVLPERSGCIRLVEPNKGNRKRDVLGIQGGPDLALEGGVEGGGEVSERFLKRVRLLQVARRRHDLSLGAAFQS